MPTHMRQIAPSLETSMLRTPVAHMFQAHPSQMLSSNTCTPQHPSFHGPHLFQKVPTSAYTQNSPQVLSTLPQTLHPTSLPTPMYYSSEYLANQNQPHQIQVMPMSSVYTHPLAPARLPRTSTHSSPPQIDPMHLHVSLDSHIFTFQFINQTRLHYNQVVSPEHTQHRPLNFIAISKLEFRSVFNNLTFG